MFSDLSLPSEILVMMNSIVHKQMLNCLFMNSSNNAMKAKSDMANYLSKVYTLRNMESYRDMLKIMVNTLQNKEEGEGEIVTMRVLDVLEKSNPAEYRLMLERIDDRMKQLAHENLETSMSIQESHGGDQKKPNPETLDESEMDLMLEVMNYIKSLSFMKIGSLNLPDGAGKGSDKKNPSEKYKTSIGDIAEMNRKQTQRHMSVNLTPNSFSQSTRRPLLVVESERTVPHFGKETDLKPSKLKLLEDSPDKSVAVVIDKLKDDAQPTSRTKQVQSTTARDTLSPGSGGSGQEGNNPSNVDNDSAEISNDDIDDQRDNTKMKQIPRTLAKKNVGKK
jgi:hypothetical protein